MNLFTRVTAALVAVLFLTTPAFADMDYSSMFEKMNQQIKLMQQTIDKQSQKIQDLESRVQDVRVSIPAPSQQTGTAPTLSEADWQKGIKDNIGEAIPWLKGAKFGGDFRLRMENFDYYDKNNDAGSTGGAADRSRNRFRIRLRWGFEKDYGDDWKVGFRLATGSTTDQTSTNQTLGNSGYFNFKTINIEKAYASYTPNGLKDYGPIKGVTITAGKMDNPFLRYSTPIVWDGDVTPEGLAEKANFQLYSSEENKLNLNTALGQFIINENTAENADAYVFGSQAALTWSTYNFNTDMPVDITTAVSYYDYNNYDTTVTPAAANSASTSYLRTNTLALGDPQILDFYPEVSFYVGRRPVTLWYNYVNNLGPINQTLVDANEIHDQHEAWGVGLKIGKAKAKNSWEAFWGYYEVGANAVAAAFSDSDFGGPDQQGYTNRKGHKFGLGYMVTDNLALNWTAFLVDPLNTTTSGVSANSRVESVFRSQLDLVYKF